MSRLEDLEEGAVLEGVDEGSVTIREIQWLSPNLLLVTYDGKAGIGADFLDRAAERTIRVDRTPEFFFRRYPAGVARLFPAEEQLLPLLARARSHGRLHAIVQAYMAEAAKRLSNPMTTVTEVYAVAGARNDGLSVAPGEQILWEVFGTRGRVEEDLRKLERDETPRRLKVAVVLDADVDEALFERFVRAIQGSPVKVWFRVTDLMLAGRFERTVRLLDEHLDALLPNDSPDQLRLVEFDLAEGHRMWRPVAGLPFGFSGLHGFQMGDDLEDPVFVLDLLNIGSREARVGSAFINVRFRQIKPHGIASERLLKPACTIELPLNHGEEGYREVKLPEPILVSPGRHVRILVRLDDAGFCWRGEVDIGLRYGPKKVLRVPTLSILR